MLVVSDASPLNFLIRIGQVDVLPALFESVILPPAVVSELTHANTPPIVRDWIRQSPEWLNMVAPQSVDPAMALGAGEREAISLAQELGADLLLVDDLKARRTALGEGLAIIGTLGVLESAATRRLLDLRTAIADLRQTNFTISDDLIREALERDAHRRRSDPLAGDASD